jgi:hypothetical protein
MHNGRRGGRRRPVPPQAIHRIVHRHHRHPGIGEFRHRIGAHQPRIVADPRILAGMVRKPSLRPVLDDVQPLPDRRIGLRLKLQRIAPVGKHRSRLRQHDRQPGAAGESREPGQALIRGRHVFAHELVIARLHEPVDPGGFHRRAHR